MRLAWLSPDSPHNIFPDTDHALTEPNGLLAAGGDLSLERLLAAYRQGIFPWFSEGEPILWWSPHPRCVLDTGKLHVSRSLHRRLKRHDYRITFDQAFTEVIKACAAPRATAQGTWLLPEMQSAYQSLHQQGWAHSIEVWQGPALIGGLYGVAIGHVFFGESMFSRQPSGSKIALYWLCRQLRHWDFPLLDAQVSSPHLLRMGAMEMARPAFLSQLQILTKLPGRPGPWRFELGLGD